MTWPYLDFLVSSLSAHKKPTSANNTLMFLTYSKAMGKHAFLLVTFLSAADTVLIMEHQAVMATEDYEQSPLLQW